MKEARVLGYFECEGLSEGLGGFFTSGRALQRGSRGLGSSILASNTLHLSWGEVGLGWVQEYSCQG